VVDTDCDKRHSELSLADGILRRMTRGLAHARPASRGRNRLPTHYVNIKSIRMSWKTLRMRTPPFLLFAALCLLSSCEALQPRSGAGAEAGAPAAGPERVERHVSLPAAKLTPELLYDLLLAEIAGQRGQTDLAARLYLEAARSTRDPRVAERATRIALLARDREKAAAAATLWVQADPENRGAREILVQLLLDEGNYEAAKPQLERLLAGGQEESLERYLIVATLLGHAPDPQAALKVMDGLVKKDGASPEALAALSTLALRADRPEEARASVERALQLRPEWIQAMLLRARILVAQGESAEAVRYLGEMVQRHPDERDLRLGYARLLIDANQLEQALAQFQVLRKDNGNDEDVLFTLGLLSMELGRPEQAREYLLKLADRGERVYEARYFLGQMAESERHFDEADRWYAGVKGGRYYLDARIRQALLPARQGDVEGARKRLQAIPVSGREAEARVSLAEGDMLREAGRLREALEVYNHALEKFPDDADLLYARALLAERMDDLNRAETDLRQILSHDPDSAEALNALGYTLADRTDRYQEALGYIQRALALKPNDPYILDSMGWVQYRLKNYGEALKYLHRAMDLQQDPEIASHLGEVLWVTGARDEAKRVWDRALQASPNSPSLQEVIRRFATPDS
jgi:tetratricopeptide (TPR) repeat protein